MNFLFNVRHICLDMTVVSFLIPASGIQKVKSKRSLTATKVFEIGTGTIVRNDIYVFVLL